MDLFLPALVFQFPHHVGLVLLLHVILVAALTSVLYILTVILLVSKLFLTFLILGRVIRQSLL